MSDTTIPEPVLLEASEKEEIEAALAPGAQLALQRQARGWSIEEVATQLNLAPRQIHAIEIENYAALPGMASVRGFIRGYAKILKIDAAPLLAMIAKEAVVLKEPMPLRRAISTPFSETRLPRMGRTSLPSTSILAVVFLILLLIGAFAIQQIGWIPALPESLLSKLKDMTISSAAAPGAQPSEGSNVAATGATNTATMSKGGTTSEPISAAAESPAPSATAAVTLENPAIASTNVLVLKVRQDSWIEATRADNTALISRLVKAGTTETIEITEPVALTIGNASGVDATWREILLDLKTSTKNNVVRLNLK